MHRKHFGPFTGTQLTIIIGLAIIAPSAVYGAATFTSVALQDATTGSYAVVDNAGRLSTRSDPALSTIAFTGSFQNIGTTPITSPTTAQLAVTQLLVSETRLNGVTNGSDLTVYLVQLSSSGASCGTSPVRYLGSTTIQSGDHVDLVPDAAPLVVAPVGGAPYCIGIQSGVTNGVADTTTYFPSYSFTAYAARGKYTGRGTGGAQEVATALAKKG